MSNETKISGNVFDLNLLKRVLVLAKPYKNAFIGATALAIILAIVGPARPWLIQKAVDDHILKFDAHGLLNIILIIGGLLVAESILRYFFNYSTKWLGQSVIKDLRVKVFDHVLKLRLKYFDTTPIGTATTRTINDVETINDIFSQGIITIIADILMLIVIIVMMFAINWELAIASMVTLPFLLYATYLFKEGVKSAFQKVRTQVSNLNAFTQEHISGMKIIQIFNAQDRELAKFKEINAKHRDAHIESIWYYSLFFPAVEIILAIATGLMVWWGAYRIIGGHLELGEIIAFILYITMLFRPIRFLADKFNTLQMGLVASNRVFTLLDRNENITDTGQQHMDDIEGRILFKNVWFAYNDEDWVIKNLSFELEKGETLAIVGSTGSGKTTIINLLSKFYEIQKGNITIDGVSINEFPLDTLRNFTSIVLQDVFLFTGTVFENITLRNEDISMERVKKAAESIGANEFIEKLPGGYNFNVMERGATLSLGQRQLISFVRALVYDPKILILDEATSSIDTESEYIIQRAIETLIKGRTSIVIAHRLSTIQNANQILVMDQGEAKEMGSHEELLNQDGYYRKLHDMQFNTITTPS